MRDELLLHPPAPTLHSLDLAAQTVTRVPGQKCCPWSRLHKAEGVLAGVRNACRWFAVTLSLAIELA